ncbi:MAG TPA: di-heme oxidoredictase family protein [Polyangiaceae bacterium]|jgi:hypothetical protein|nr:di-heme oxidoredictase family protein [Polyangiaceae bacterium]
MKTVVGQWPLRIVVISTLATGAACGARDSAPPERSATAEQADTVDTAAGASSQGPAASSATNASVVIGQEISVPHHLTDGDEFRVGLPALLAQGQTLFTANWTIEEGGGRPLSKGTGAPISDPTSPLIFPRNFNKLSTPDGNACSGCHNAPFGLPGGGGDFTTGVFVLGQRFDFMTFDQTDLMPTRGDRDELGRPTIVQTFADFRATPGLVGSGFIEMLSRQMTADLQAIRDAIAPGHSAALSAKGVTFGTLTHNADSTWDVSAVEGLPLLSLVTTGTTPPTLAIRPFHASGDVVSLREFSNNAFNHHHGIQSEERFGLNVDADGDGFVNELTRADVTSVAIFQATRAVPGRVIPRNRVLQRAVAVGETQFDKIGCNSCHIDSLPLDDGGWIFVEPNPFNPLTNLQAGTVPNLSVDLTNPSLPSPRLAVHNGVVNVAAYTDLKRHDITDGTTDNADPLEQTAPPGSPAFFAGEHKFLTKKLWGAANEPPFFHHGKFVTLRQAVLAHAGEAAQSTAAFNALSAYQQSCVIEFLKSLQVLPPNTSSLVIDEAGQPRTWDVATVFAQTADLAQN